MHRSSPSSPRVCAALTALALFLTLLQGLAAANDDNNTGGGARGSFSSGSSADAPRPRLGRPYRSGNGNDDARASSSLSSSSLLVSPAADPGTGWRQLQRLPDVVTFTGDTTNASASAGNPVGSCGGNTGCINGCPSHFYKLIATRNVTSGARVEVSSCQALDPGSPDAPFNIRTYVWKGGSGSACGSFTCVGKDGALYLLACCNRTNKTSHGCFERPASSDDACRVTDDGTQRFKFSAMGGEEYYIQVTSDSPDAFGKYSLAIATYYDYPMELFTKVDGK
jgi:hypothetical protein